MKREEIRKRGMGKKKVILFVSFFVLSIVLINLISAEGFEVSDKGVEYDSELIGQFLLSDWVHVTIKIYDTSNIVISKGDSVGVQTAKDNQRSSILNNISDSVLAALSRDEFQLEGKFPIGNGFYGNITKEGFNKLLKDTRVKKIYAEKEIRIHSMTIVKNITIYLAPIVLLIILVIMLIKVKKGQWKKKKKR